MTGSVKIVWCLSFAIMSFAARAEHDMDEYRAMNELVQRCIDGEAAGLESLKSNVVAKAGPFIERMKTAGLADDEAGFLSDFEADCESGNPARMDYPLFVARAVILAEMAKRRNVRGCEDFVAAVEDGLPVLARRAMFGKLYYEPKQSGRYRSTWEAAEIPNSVTNVTVLGFALGEPVKCDRMRPWFGQQKVQCGDVSTGCREYRYLRIPLTCGLFSRMNMFSTMGWDRLFQVELLKYYQHGERLKWDADAKALVKTVEKELGTPLTCRYEGPAPDDGVPKYPSPRVVARWQTGPEFMDGKVLITLETKDLPRNYETILRIQYLVLVPRRGESGKSD